MEQFLLIYNFVEDRVTDFAINPAGNGYEMIYADLD